MRQPGFPGEQFRTLIGRQVKSVSGCRQHTDSRCVRRCPARHVGLRKRFRQRCSSRATAAAVSAAKCGDVAQVRKTSETASQNILQETKPLPHFGAINHDFYRACHLPKLTPHGALYLVSSWTSSNRPSLWSGEAPRPSRPTFGSGSQARGFLRIPSHRPPLR
jgi:hypothetical protein